MSTQPDTIREAFEAWAKKAYTTPKLIRRGEFDYIDVQTAIAFDAWHAATEQAARVCERLGPDSTNAECADAVRRGGV